MIAKKKPPWRVAFLENFELCVSLDGTTTQKPERFKDMINRKLYVCQAMNTRPSWMGIYENA